MKTRNQYAPVSEELKQLFMELVLGQEVLEANTMGMQPYNPYQLLFETSESTLKHIGNILNSKIQKKSGNDWLEDGNDTAIEEKWLRFIKLTIQWIRDARKAERTEAVTFAKAQREKAILEGKLVEKQLKAFDEMSIEEIQAEIAKRS